jgi:putative ubiquitin-RnfH superfamily antitoxin RatB of RatAB toxin-antitoxin module
MTDPGASAAGGIAVSVVYALPERYWCVELRLPAGATVGDALAAAALAAPGLAISPDRLAVFGRVVGPEAPLHEGDRVEILRPLAIDPKDARRARAAAASRKPAR